MWQAVIALFPKMKFETSFNMKQRWDVGKLLICKIQ